MTQICIGRLVHTLEAQNIFPVHIRANPLPVFTPLRRISARNRDGSITVALAHIFDGTVEIEHRVPPTKEELNLLDNDEGKIFQWYTDNLFITRHTNDHVIFYSSLYIFLSEKHKAPFSCAASKKEPTQPLKLLPRTQGMDTSKEFREAYHKTFFIKD